MSQIIVERWDKDEMNIAIGKIREAATKYDELYQIVKKHKYAEKRLKTCNSSGYKFVQMFLIFAIGTAIAFSVLIIVCLGALVWSGRLYNFTTESPYYDIMYNNWVGLLPKLCGLVVVISFPLIVLVSILGGIKLAKKGLKSAMEEDYECNVILERFVQDNAEIITFLPKSYRYPLAANFIAEVLENGRADTLKEAFNLYEEQLHRWKMENKMNKLIEEQKKCYTTVWYL